MTKKPLVLVIVQNLPLPGDRRVWLECKSLRDEGYEVAAITPAAPGDSRYELHEGVHLWKYKPPRATESKVSFVWEFVYCWIRTLVLALNVTWKLRRPAVIQTCNPPDTYWLLGLLFRPFGTRFVFDQHDLNPELFESRFGKRGPLYRALCLLEKANYRVADQVVSTNESYAQTAVERGGVDRACVTVVRTGPDTDLLRPSDPDVALKHGREFLVHFHGVMGPQDGVDLVIQAAYEITHRHGRDDVFFSVLGAGDCWTELRARVTALGLDDVVYMPGRVSDEELFSHLSTADIGLSADPPNPLNDVSTMNKTMEYMAFGVPIVAFDLKETRVSAGDSAIFVPEPSANAYADQIVRLLDDPVSRKTMSERGMHRARTELDWKFQRAAYVAAIDAALSPAASERLSN